MKVAGFSFIRNAIKYDYPVVEAITSVLPLCDEFVIAFGESEDETLALLKSIPSSKIRIIYTTWDDNLREGGKVLAQETDKALAAISADVDWAFYIQGDEVLHERYLPVVKEAMTNYLTDEKVEGLLFKYLHFYGSYNYFGNSRRWYRREIRVIRNTGNVYAYRDAQGFRKKENKKLNVKLIDAYIYHYGWVKSLEKQRSKVGYFARFWHSEEQVPDAGAVDRARSFDYAKHIDSLAVFEETHPMVMEDRIMKSDQSFTFDTRQRRYSLRVRLSTFVETITGWRAGEYRNYKIIK
ncbi:MAG: glycosyltransferase family 2 protein [Bacteroidetes bacterium]|nr:glycosyltransferase family 2 protein [Fibrella sp.]